MRDRGDLVMMLGKRKDAAIASLKQIPDGINLELKARSISGVFHPRESLRAIRCFDRAVGSSGTRLDETTRSTLLDDLSVFLSVGRINRLQYPQENAQTVCERYLSLKDKSVLEEVDRSIRNRGTISGVISVTKSPRKDLQACLHNSAGDMEEDQLVLSYAFAASASTGLYAMCAHLAEMTGCKISAEACAHIRFVQIGLKLIADLLSVKDDLKAGADNAVVIAAMYGSVSSMSALWANGIMPEVLEDGRECVSRCLASVNTDIEREAAKIQDNSPIVKFADEFYFAMRAELEQSIEPSDTREP